jgi:hypothetical protein
VLVFSLLLFGIALFWVSAVVAIGLRRNARCRADNQASRSARPIAAPTPNTVILHPPTDLYRPGHAATHHPAA